MTKTPNPVSILIKNDPAEIARLSQAVDELGRWRGIAPETLYAVNLALDEILTNVISYGYEDKGEQAIVVRLALEEDEIVAEIEDSARPFNLCKPRRRTLPLE
jgi:anti-sigma regulatory factor (Ser/Thr protein kinase)